MCLSSLLPQTKLPPHTNTRADRQCLPPFLIWSKVSSVATVLMMALINVCVRVSICVQGVLDALLLPFPLLQFSVAWPLTWPFDLFSADHFLAIQLWNRLCVCVSEHICALVTSWRSCVYFEWKNLMNTFVCFLLVWVPRWFPLIAGLFALTLKCERKDLCTLSLLFHSVFPDSLHPLQRTWGTAS